LGLNIYKGNEAMDSFYEHLFPYNDPVYIHNK
jgi:hypothetical protein